MEVDIVLVLALLLMASGIVLIAIGFLMGGRREEPGKEPGYRVNGAR